MSGHPGVLLHAYLDRELSAERCVEVDSHLTGCEKCRAELDAASQVRSLLRTHRSPSTPSPQLLARIHRALEPKPRRPLRVAAMSFAIAAAAGLLVLLVVPRRPSGNDGELVSAHLRSLQAQHLTDVASSDRHTVKPYFQGRLDYAFPVRDFTAAGFPLEGGRIDVLGERPVAALVYRSNAHVINAFVRLSDGRPAVGSRRWSHSGFNLLRFEAEGFTVELVSDAAPEVLDALAAAWHE